MRPWQWSVEQCKFGGLAQDRASGAWARPEAARAYPNAQTFPSCKSGRGVGRERVQASQRGTGWRKSDKGLLPEVEKAWAVNNSASFCASCRSVVAQLSSARADAAQHDGGAPGPSASGAAGSAAGGGQGQGEGHGEGEGLLLGVGINALLVSLQLRNGALLKDLKSARRCVSGPGSPPRLACARRQEAQQKKRPRERRGCRILFRDGRQVQRGQ
eukprot:Tamp_23537.p1 GENE.Tamp_23537~~Tamp_23537.p1  ORF type:complete len:215 (+),score=23.45 Tamp_23537:169-813(+)